VAQETISGLTQDETGCFWVYPEIIENKYSTHRLRYFLLEILQNKKVAKTIIVTDEHNADSPGKTFPYD